MFDTGDKELSFGDDNSDLFPGVSPAASKVSTILALLVFCYVCVSLQAQTSNNTPATVGASKPKRMPNPLFDDDDDELDWLS